MADSAVPEQHCPTCRCRHGTGAALTAARVSHGLTQGQAASLIGVSQPTISFWENGQREPDSGQAARIDAVFGTSLSMPEGVA